MTEPSQKNRELRERLLAMDRETATTDAAALLFRQEAHLRQRRRVTIVVWLVLLAMMMACIALRIADPRVPDAVSRILENVAFIIAYVFSLLFLYGVYCVIRLLLSHRSLTLSRISAQLTNIERRLEQMDKKGGLNPDGSD